LRPEKSTTWTAGLDFIPSKIPKTKLSVTYFDIDFRDRIADPLQGGNLFSALQEESLYSSVITRNPPLSEIAPLFARPGFINPGNIAVTDVGAIFDDRLANIATRKQSGVDVSLSNTLDAPLGSVRTQVSGTYLFNIRTQLTPTAPFNEVAGTLYFPSKFRFRGSLAWSIGGFETTAFVNYTASYQDPTTQPAVPVASWTTIDLSLRYDLERAGARSWLRGMQASVTAQNVLNRNPPFVNNPNGLNFDPSNANPFGRIVAIQLTKKW
jgi:hypothetical protein